MRYPLVDGQGNFGSVDGDSAGGHALHRGALQQIAVEMLRDIDEETVDWMPNYDETRREPKVLPAAFPTCWSTARPASPSAWRPTSRRTTSARSSTRRCT